MAPAVSDVVLRGVSSGSNSVVWASGQHGTYLRSIDGGETWETGQVPGAEELDFRDVEAFDDSTALLLSTELPASVYKTTDGGESWELKYESTRKGMFFNAMAFWDPKRGIAVGDPIDGEFFLLATEDGGESWSHLQPRLGPKSLDGEANFAGSGTCLTVGSDGDVWFGSGGSRAGVHRSSDFGDTWEVSETPLPSEAPSKGVYSLSFFGSMQGVIVGGDYKDIDSAENNVAWTDDGGRSWYPIEGPGVTGFREAVRQQPGSGGRRLFAVGPNGIDFSNDSGQSWQRAAEGEFHSVTFSPDGSLAWAVGANGLVASYEPPALLVPVVVHR